MALISINENDNSMLSQININNRYSGIVLDEILRLQDKTVNIISNVVQTVTFDTGYQGLRNVTISVNVPAVEVATIKEITLESPTLLRTVDQNDVEHTVILSYNTTGNLTSILYDEENINVIYDDSGVLTKVGGTVINGFS